MLKKFVAPVLIGGALLVGGVAVTGAAYAATPAPTAPVADHATKGQIKDWMRAHRRDIRQAGVAVSAKTIGVTPQVLVADLRAGNSIAGVATQHGVSTQAVVNALVSAADGKVDQFVAAGKLSSTQAKVVEAKIPTLVDKAVARTF